MSFTRGVKAKVLVNGDGDAQLTDWLLDHDRQKNAVGRIPALSQPACDKPSLGMPLPVQIMGPKPVATEVHVVNKIDQPEKVSRAIRNREEIQFVSDKLLWCEDCGISKMDDCNIHGPSFHVKDRVIPSRAKLTAPHFVVIRKVELRAGGNHVCGAFAKKVIQRRTRFGPYEGNTINHWHSDHTDKLKLQVFLNNGDSHFLDCTDQSVCNWMMFVRPATSVDEQNLVAYQYNGGIYFCSTKPIPQNGELKVWYAKEYAALMGQKIIPAHQKMDIESRSACHVELKTALKTAMDEKISLDSTQQKERITPIKRDRIDKRSASNPDDESAYEFTSTSMNTKQNIQQPESVAFDKMTCGSPLDSSSPWCTVEIKDGSVDYEETEASSKNPEIPPCAECGEIFSMLQDKEDHNCDDMGSIVSIRSSSGRLIKPTSRRTRSMAIRSKRKGQPIKLEKRKIIPTGTSRVESASNTGQKKFLKTKTKLKSLKQRRTGSGKMKKSCKTPGELYNCQQCGKSFPTQQKLTVHSFIHTGEKPFRCETEGCTRGFTTKFKLIRHQLVHSDDRQHQCPYCDKAFGRKDHLKNHLKIHDPNKALRQCEQCGKEYASSFAFRTHLAIHAADKGGLRCGVCNAEFGSTEQIKDHLKIHAGARSTKDGMDKKHVCPFCSKRFYTKKDIRRHLVVHTKVRDYLCQYCPQRFGRKDHLVRHLKRSHSSELPYEDPPETDVSFSNSHQNLKVDNQSNEAENSQMVTDLLRTVNKYMGESLSSSSITSSSNASKPRKNQIRSDLFQPINNGNMYSQVQSAAAGSIQTTVIGAPVYSQAACINAVPQAPIQPTPSSTFISTLPSCVSNHSNTDPSSSGGFGNGTVYTVVNPIIHREEDNNHIYSQPEATITNINQGFVHNLPGVTVPVSVVDNPSQHGFISSLIMPSHFTQQNVAHSAAFPLSDSSAPSQTTVGALHQSHIPVVDNFSRLPVLLNPSQTPVQIRTQPEITLGTAQTKMIPRNAPLVSRRIIAPIQATNGGHIPDTRPETVQISQPSALTTQTSSSSSMFPTLIVSYHDPMKLCLLQEKSIENKTVSS